ncbi:MAG: hypothetical protein HYY16_19475 [Planctomycetes bacterium]|nr:hypothetical protein [Planctomycetota bacterium]
MSCIAPEHLVELLERGGLDVAGADERRHLAECAQCTDAWSRIAFADDILRDAPAFQRQPGFARVFVGAAAAASILMAILIAIQPDPPQARPTQQAESKPDPMKLFLDGSQAESTAARLEILARGTDAVPALLEERARRQDEGHWQALNDLLFEIKSSAATDEGRKALVSLAEHRVNFKLNDAYVRSVLDLLARVAITNLAIDPQMRGACDIRPTHDTARRVLDVIATKLDLDYDYRFGVIWLTSPKRLWPVPKPIPPLTATEEKIAQAWVAALGADSLEERDRASLELRLLGRAVIPLIEAGARGEDTGRAARCRDLLDAFRRPVPLSNAWRAQALALADRPLAARLLAARVTLTLNEAFAGDCLGLLKRVADFEVVTDAAVQEILVESRLTLYVRDLPCSNALELITLPQGLDAKIENGKVVLYVRQDP